MISLFALAELTVTRSQVSSWLKKEEDPEQIHCNDKTLAYFLNGLINEKRGKKEGTRPAPEDKLNNNIIFTKLKIALNLKAEDVLRIMEIAGFVIGKSELSAFFRKRGHKHYRECQDQILRNFLQGIQLVYRDGIDTVAKSKWIRR